MDERERPDKPLTTSVAGRLLGCTGRTIRNLIKRGMLPAVKIGSDYRVFRNALIEYKKKQQMAPSFGE